MTNAIPHIQKFERLGPYRLRLWFTDGMVGDHDFSALANDPRGMTHPFRDPIYFDQVFLDFGALTWPNGFDWCPDALHTDMMKAGELSLDDTGRES